MKVSKRDFLKSTNKYLKPGRIVLTFHGKDDLELTIVRTSDTKARVLNDVVTDKVETIIKKVPEVKRAADIAPRFIPNHTRMPTTYGCGCKKGEESLCGKHARG